MADHSVRGLASSLKAFLANQEEDEFITAAATHAAAGLSAPATTTTQDSSAKTHPVSAPQVQGGSFHQEYKDTLTVEFARKATHIIPATLATHTVDTSANYTAQAVNTLATGQTPVLTPVSSEELPMNTKQKTAALATLAQTISACRRCPLGSARLNAVPGEGDPNARLMFVGEGPGFDEDRQGRPFVGRAGQLLDKMITAMGLKREEVYIANIAKCHPMTDPSHPDIHGNDRAPNAEEIAFCRNYLEQQIATILPEYVVALGGVASKALIADAKSLGALRGQFHTLHLDTVELKRPVKILATFHPAALLRNPGWKKDAWADLQMVMAAMGLPPSTQK